MARCQVTVTRAFAPATWSNLLGHFRKYKSFCKGFALQLFPLTVRNIVPFLQYYSMSVACYSTVANVFSSIKTWSKLYGHVPSDLLLYKCNLLLLGLKRSMVTSVRQMLPITPSILYKLYTCIDFTSTFHVCMWAAMLFLFFTFLRKSNVLPNSSAVFDDQSQVCRKHVSLYSNYMLITVGHSKTNQFGQRSVVIPVAAIPGSVLCPVAAFVRLLQRVPASRHSSPFCYLGPQGRVVLLTYPLFVRQLRTWLRQLGIVHHDLYSTHSFRRGGATLAFKAGVNPQLIKAQGDWASDCYLKYVSLSLDHRLGTTRAMANSIVATR